MMIWCSPTLVKVISASSPAGERRKYRPFEPLSSSSMARLSSRSSGRSSFRSGSLGGVEEAPGRVDLVRSHLVSALVPFNRDIGAARAQMRFEPRRKVGRADRIAPPGRDQDAPAGEIAARPQARTGSADASAPWRRTAPGRQTAPMRGCWRRSNSRGRAPPKALPPRHAHGRRPPSCRCARARSSMS